MDHSTHAHGGHATHHQDHAAHAGHAGHDMASDNRMAVSATLHCLTGYTLSTLPLLRAGLGVGTALGVVLAADTPSPSPPWRSSTTW